MCISIAFRSIDSASPFGKALGPAHTDGAHGAKVPDDRFGRTREPPSGGPVENGRHACARFRTLLGMANPVQLIADTVRDRARRGELDVGAEEAVREELHR